MAHDSDGDRFVQSFRTPRDVADLDYARDLADPDQYPFTRGHLQKETGTKAWIQRELSGEGDARRSNRQLRYLIDHGAKGLDVIGDSPTVALMDPDHPYARLAVGTQGVSLCRAEDYIALYEGIPLGEISVSHSLPPWFAIAGLYLAAESQGVPATVLRGSVINAPFYMEDYGYATFLDFDIRLRLALDVIEFASEHMPKFHPFVEDTYFISDGGIGPVEEMAFGFVEIREVVRSLLRRGMDIDSFAPRIAILVNCRMDLLTEIAKVRATRRIYARMMREEFGARDPRSWSANITVHTSGASLTSQQPLNNVVRGALQAFAMALAGVTAMEISAFDEAYRTPSEAAHLVGLRSQQIIALETDAIDVADPLGGSYHIEQLTNEIEQKILNEVASIEAEGPAAECFERGYFRARFQQAMVSFSAEIADGTRSVVGVNCLRVPTEEDLMLRDQMDEKIEPYEDHIKDIRRWKAQRSGARISDLRSQIREAASNNDENIMPVLLEVFRGGLTAGEITEEIRLASGRAADPLNAGRTLS